MSAIDPAGIMVFCRTAGHVINKLFLLGIQPSTSLA